MEYPRPDTAAVAALAHIRATPGCSQNALGQYLGTGEAHTRRILDRLARYGYIVVNVDHRGHKRIAAIEDAE